MCIKMTKNTLLKRTYQIIDFMIVCEEGLSFSVLVLDESLNVQVEALRRGTLVGLCGQLALLEEERQKGEQRMPEKMKH